MAFDTVIDKSQLEAAITASADAIREKTGDAALIEWRPNKGFAEAIAAIGGLPNGITALSSGEFTPTADSQGITIAHGLDVTPNYYFIVADAIINATNYSNYGVWGCYTDKPFLHDGNNYQGTFLARGFYSGYLSNTAFDRLSSHTLFTSGGCDATYIYIPTGVKFPLKAKTTYYWIAAFIDCV